MFVLFEENLLKEIRNCNPQEAEEEKGDQLFKTPEPNNNYIGGCFDWEKVPKQFKGQLTI